VNGGVLLLPVSGGSAGARPWRQRTGLVRGREILAFNPVSSPGSGKTTLLERIIRDLKSELQLYVIEGDQATANDGERIRAAGAPAVQVNTGAGCHIEADMVARGLAELKPPPGSVVMIEMSATWCVRRCENYRSEASIRSTRCARDGPGSNRSAKYWVSLATRPSRNSMMLTVYDGMPS
jgi:CobW/HypB/UreG, nucleotide-binding domain